MNARIFGLLFLLVPAATAQTPHWIWHVATNAPKVYLRKTFRTPPLTWNARLTVAADDSAEVFLNGVAVGRCADWRQPMRSELSVRLNQGENVIAIKGENTVGDAGVLVHFNVNGQTNILSDSSWLISTNEEPNWTTLAFNAAHWSSALAIAPHGGPPRGEVLFQGAATPAEDLKVAEGFRVQLLRSAGPDEGSWICMAFDERGRLIVSPQGDQRPLLRMTLDNGLVTQVEKFNAPIRYAMGLLFAFDSLYANARGPGGAGLYRLVDENKNDQFETNEVRLLGAFKGESEHGYHALALGPDRKIYVLNGNGTKLPEGISSLSPYRNYAEDALTGSRGQDEDQDGSKAPACHVLQTDSEGREWKLWAGGMRNAYDMDFNEDGELFTFDSDMEWDWGTPWYRPTRILHLVSGGEYGWRDGTRMWSTDYPDSLPAVASVGIGSPTGVKFGTKSNFPAKYRRALYAMDWSYGRIVAVHLNATNSTYAGRWENFVQGTPLNLTSLAFGPDGAMYFVTGGRGTQSGLYRVSATAKSDGPAVVRNDAPTAARKVRHQLEELHLRTDPDSLEFILNQIYTANDRFIGHAARVALEAQPLELWKTRALQAKGGLPGPLALLLALARTAGAETTIPIISRSLDLYEPNPLTLRIIEIALARHGDPSVDLSAALVSRLDPVFPSHDQNQNHQLCRILLRLGAKDAVRKSMRLLQSATFQEEQMFYIEQLRNVSNGWTVEDRRTFFDWFLRERNSSTHSPELQGYFADVGRGYVDGAWFDKYLRDFRRQAANTLTSAEKSQLETLLARPLVPARNVAGPERPFVRNWRMEDLLPDLGKSPPNLALGRQALAHAQCLTCHRFGNDGGIAGPELTGAGDKYAARDILESIVEPSKVLSDQYQNHIVILNDGDSVTGRLVSDSENEVVVETDRLAGTNEKIPRHKIAAVRPSPLSPMPEGLVNILTKEEILGLIEYLRSGIKPR